MSEGLFSAATKAVVKKEFLSVLKDKRSRMILVVPVVMYIILFGYIASFNLERIPYAVCDLSHSAASAELVRSIEAGGIFRRQATLTSVAEINLIAPSRRTTLSSWSCSRRISPGVSPKAGKRPLR